MINHLIMFYHDVQSGPLGLLGCGRSDTVGKNRKLLLCVHVNSVKFCGSRNCMKLQGG